MAESSRGTRSRTAQREADVEKSHKPRARGVPGKTRSPVSLPMLRTSERGALKRCEFLWHISYNRRLKPLGEAPALRFGSLVHKALAQWYIPGTKRGVSPVRAFKKAYDADLVRNNELFGMRLEEDEQWHNAEELGLAMMRNYLDEYGTDPEWEVLVTEHPFQVIVPYPENVLDETVVGEPPREGDPWFMYTGVLDGIWKNRKTKEIWIPDHKTAQGIHRKLNYLQMDDQAGAYWSFGVEYLVQNQFLKANQQLNGMLYNFMRKAIPDERHSKLVNGTRMYLNLDGSISKKQPSPYFLRQPIFRDEYDRRQVIERAMNDYRRIELFRSGELPMSKSPGQFTCPGCPVLDICELHETGHDYEGYIKSVSKPWDPYAEHEVYDGR